MVESDGIPNARDLLRPVLSVLSDGTIKTVDQLVLGVIDSVGLSREVLNVNAKNKAKSELKSRVEWACTDLRKRGLIEFPYNNGRKTSNRRILPLGVEVLRDGKDPLDMPEIDVEDWYPVMYSPGLSEGDWLELLSDSQVFNRRSIDLMSKMLSFGGEATCTQLSQRFGGSPQTYNSTAIHLARRVHQKTGCPIDVKDSGADRFWSILFQGRPAGRDVPGAYVWRIRPELMSALSDYGVVSEDSSDQYPTVSFFDYLEEKGLEFDTQAVENFLLSLKAKQFVILSGGTGTGKTGLAKAYGEFLSESGHELEMRTLVTLGKSIENNGFTLSREDFFKVFPDSARADGVYDYTIGDCSGKGEIKMTPRFWFVRDDRREDVLEHLRRMREVGDKAELILKVPSGNPAEKRYEIVPVGSNWTDNRHILGYRNAISGDYHHTPSLDLILASDRDQAHQYVLILDEMNLSHVERYFSDIISCMESGSPISLDSDGSVPGSVTMGENLFVVGTVNMDETTYAFSPKVLDRANVIEFDPPSVSGYLGGDDVSYSPTGDVKYLQNAASGIECRRMSARDILLEMSDTPTGDIVSQIVRDLSDIQERMRGMKLPFAYRTLDEVMRFMYVAWNYEGRGEFSNWRRYMDAQIRQKILPKIHGNTSILQDLRALVELCDGRGYTRSGDKLRRMTSVLEAQRYVSFNC